MEQNITVITVATHDKGYLQALVESCEKNNFDIKVLGFGEKWGGFAWKFKKLREYLENICNPYDIVIFLDGYDTLCINNKEKLMEKFLKMDTPIVVSKDSIPNNILHSYLHSKVFDTCDDIHINSGMYMGYVWAVRNLLNIICSKTDCNDKDVDDQREMINLCNSENIFFKNNVKIDVDNKIFFNTTPENPPFSHDLNLKKTKLQIKDNKLQTFSGKDFVFISGPGNTNLDVVLKIYNLKNKAKRRNEKQHLLKIIPHYLQYLKLEMFLFFIFILFILIIIFKKK